MALLLVILVLLGRVAREHFEGVTVLLALLQSLAKPKSGVALLT